MKDGCCFIPHDQQEAAKAGQKVPGCPRDAEWEIFYPPDPANSTLACSEHVGHLCEDKENRVYPYSQPT